METCGVRQGGFSSTDVFSPFSWMMWLQIINPCMLMLVSLAEQICSVQSYTGPFSIEIRQYRKKFDRVQERQRQKWLRGEKPYCILMPEVLDWRIHPTQYYDSQKLPLHFRFVLNLYVTMTRSTFGYENCNTLTFYFNWCCYIKANLRRFDGYV